MARKKQAPPAGNPGSQVTVCPVEGSPALITIGPEDGCWESAVPPGMSVVVWNGSFVRIRPPASASEERIEQVRHLVTQLAAKVVVEPARRSQPVTAPKERAPHLQAREVVGLMIEEANVEDRDALRRLCEEVMGRAGL